MRAERDREESRVARVALLASEGREQTAKRVEDKQDQSGRGGLMRPKLFKSVSVNTYVSVMPADRED